MNLAMRNKVETGEAINVASNLDKSSGNYLLPSTLKDRIVGGADLCDLDRERWIWLVVEPVAGGGPLVAFTDPRATTPEGYVGIWYR